MGNKKNKILIFLPHYEKNHESYYSGLINDVFKDGKYDVLIFSKDLHTFNRFNKSNWHFPDKNESLTYFALRHLNLFIKSKLIVQDEIFKISFISTVLLLVFGHKSLLTIHNVNKWLNRRTNKQIIKNLLFRFIVKLILHRLLGIIVISLSLRDYIKEHNLFNKKIFYIPFTNLETISNSKQFKDEVVFTIPGSVNSERRNYKSFLEAVLNYNKIDNLKQIKLILLGKIVNISKAEENLIKEINSTKHDTIKYWNEYIDSSTYQKELLNTDFLIGNIKLEYKENLITEKYGKTKETGVLFLMLKYQIPTLFPEEYSSSPIYRGLIIEYNEKEILNKIIDLANNQQKQYYYNYDKHKDILKQEIHKLNKLLSDV